MKMMNNDIVLFETKDKEIKLSVSVDNDTVWLSANQMALLFDRDEKTIRKHINNVFNENELDRTNNTQKMRVVGVKQKVPFKRKRQGRRNNSSCIPECIWRGLLSVIRRKSSKSPLLYDKGSPLCRWMQTYSCVFISGISGKEQCTV